MTIDDATIEKVTAAIRFRGDKLLHPGDLLVIDWGEVVYIEGMTVGDYFAEAIVAKYKPRIRSRAMKADSRPYYRKFGGRY